MKFPITIIQFRLWGVLTRLTHIMLYIGNIFLYSLKVPYFAIICVVFLLLLLSDLGNTSCTFFYLSRSVHGCLWHFLMLPVSSQVHGSVLAERVPLHALAHHLSVLPRPLTSAVRWPRQRHCLCKSLSREVGEGQELSVLFIE